MPQQIIDFWFVNGAWLCRNLEKCGARLFRNLKSRCRLKSPATPYGRTLDIILMSRKCSNPLRRIRAD